MSQAAINGEEVVITHNDRPILKLASFTQEKKCQPSSDRGLIQMSDNFDKSLIMEKVRLINAKLLDLSKVIIVTLLVFNSILLTLEFTGIFNQFQIKPIIIANATTIEHTLDLIRQISPLVAIPSFFLSFVAFEYDEDRYPLLFFAFSAIVVLFTAEISTQLLLY